jgi:ABC-type multidrug transport system ATPase subunit/predicted component of type VI protein secretion system
MSQDDTAPKSSWVIGRTEGCDLVVPFPSVSSRHCRLSQFANGYTVEDLGSTNGTYVNGARIAPHDPVRVAHGTRITLGGEVEMPWPGPKDRPSGRGATVVNARVSSGGTARSVVAPVSGPKPITIGRSPESDVQIDLPIISWKHAEITLENGQYILTDQGSTNGTAIGELSNRIQRAVLQPTDEVYFGSYKISASQLISKETKVEIGEAAFHKVSFQGNSMEIGRDPQCDIPLDFPMVSWRHARLTRTENGILVEDLGSRNGTYVDGVRVSGTILVRPGQDIGLGTFRFQLLADGELAKREYSGNVTIEAKDIVVCTPNHKQRLLNPVSLTVFPSELVALMGPAGAGKTTLLKALNGYTKPTEGTVLFNGANLYKYYDRFRQQMGYVPQDDIVHPQLTVRQALYFSARLRTDLSEAEIETRTEKVLRDLDIYDKIDLVIGSPERKTLSGGQRKRVNIGLELITDTPVLFLDEPTSGLSSYDAESVVDLLKNLSKTGKTIITTIHQPSLKVYKQFDDLIMISRDKGSPGAMVFFGPAFPDSIQFFNAATPGAHAVATPQELNPEMLFTGMNTAPKDTRTEVWRRRYEASRYRQEFVTNRSGKQPASDGKTGEESPRRQFGVDQWIALVKRNVFVKIQDRTQTAILIAQAPVFALLVWLINYPLSADHFDELSAKLPIVHFLMVVAAIWFGCNNAARDIVGEWSIYKRERMITLKLGSYVFSKLAVLLALCVFQCGSLLGIVYLSCGLHSNFLAEFAVLLTASMIGAALGLCISAVSETNESAIAMLPLVLLPIIALGGGMRPIYLMPKVGQVLSMVIPSRWSFEANLLNEASAKQWGGPKPIPDLTCSLNLDDLPVGSLPPSVAGPLALNPSLAIQGDAAEMSVPAYVIEFTDAHNKQHLCRATAEEGFPLGAPIVNAEKNRHSFGTSFSVLLAMLVILVSSVIGILRKRDNDPQ